MSDFRFFVVAAIGTLGLLGLSFPVMAGEVLPGPIPAHVERVIDGDTIEVKARIWIGQEVRVQVRLDGVDTPELRGKCEDEKARARVARDHLAPIIGSDVELTGIYEGKFAGRVVARVGHAEMGDLATSLLMADLARPYDGGKRQPWCEAQTALR